MGTVPIFVRRIEMKMIQVFGPGCPKCKKLAEDAEKAAKELGIEYQLEKVTDINVMTGYGIMTTPALAVDGQVKITGRCPSVKELKDIIGK